MKSKLLVLLSTLLTALMLLAQSTTQTPPQPAGDEAKTCTCCNHGTANDSKATCCGKDGKCAMMSKDGKQATTQEHMMSGNDTAANKCPMMAKDNKMTCCGKDGGCCHDGKCDMTNDDKSCCDGKQCARPQTGA